MVNVTNKQLKDIMTDVAGHVVVLSAKVEDVITEQAKIRSEVDKQTALANQIHMTHDTGIERLTEIVEGNGKPGLKTDIAEVRGDIRLVSNRLAWLIAILVALFVPVYGGAIGFAYGLVKIPKTSEIDCCPPTSAPIATEHSQLLPTATPEPTPTKRQPVPRGIVTPEYVPTDSELDALGRLCTVEVKAMTGVRDDACLSVISTVMTRLERRLFSDGTIAGTITYNCGPDAIECHFPAYSYFGCEGIISTACPWNYPKDVAHFTDIAEQYFEGRRGVCSGFIYYGMKPFDMDGCIIQAANGLWQGWHGE